MPDRGSALGRAGAAALRSCTMWVLDTFFYHAENIAEEVIMKWRSGATNRWGRCAVSLAFILHKQIGASCSTGFPRIPRVRPIRSRAALSLKRTPPFLIFFQPPWFASVSERLLRNRRNGGSAAAQSPATQTNQRRWSMGYPGNLPAPLGMPLWCLASLSRPNCSPALTNVPVGLYGEKS